MEWQPIDTAPKDGEMVLVNDTTFGFTPWVAASYHGGDEWSGWVYDDATTQDCNPLGPNPTHWLPVPPLPDNVELSGARRASDSNAGLDDAVRYWLCCGSKVYPHGAESCYEARAGHPERVRWGTAKEHSEWQKKKSSNAELTGARRASDLSALLGEGD